MIIMILMKKIIILLVKDTRKKYRLGDIVKIKVVDANLVKGHRFYVSILMIDNNNLYN